MQKKTVKKNIPIKVKYVPNPDLTSAKLVFDENGENLIEVIANNPLDYYQFQVNNDQIGISKFGKHWRVVPSRVDGDNKHNWYVEKLAWCLKNKGNINLKINDVQNILHKFIKRTSLKIFE